MRAWMAVAAGMVGLLLVPSGAAWSKVLEVDAETRAEIVNPATGETRLLVRFDMSGLPENARILHAEMAMELASVQTGRSRVELAVHEVGRAWGPGAGWQGSWKEPGGDYGSVAEDVWTLVRGERARTRFNVTERVKAWRGGAENHGLLVRVADDPAARFAVKETPEGVKLRVLYVLEPLGR